PVGALGQGAAGCPPRRMALVLLSQPLALFPEEARQILWGFGLLQRLAQARRSRFGGLTHEAIASRSCSAEAPRSRGKTIRARVIPSLVSSNFPPRSSRASASTICSPRLRSRRLSKSGSSGAPSLVTSTSTLLAMAERRTPRWPARRVANPC